MDEVPRPAGDQTASLNNTGCFQGRAGASAGHLKAGKSLLSYATGDEFHVLWVISKLVPARLIPPTPGVRNARQKSR